MKPFSDRQREIMDAALDIIAVRGMQGMTVKNLARALGISEPALYRHFKSKHDLMLSILVMYKNFITGMALERRASVTGAIAKIGSFYGELFRSFAEKPALSMVIFSEDFFRYDKRLSREAFGVIEMTHDAIESMLKEGVRQGEIRTDVPSRQMSWMVMGTMRLIVAKWRISGYALDLEGEGRKLLSYMWKVLGA